MIWKEKRLLLLVLGVLLAANTIFFFTYRVQYENRLRDLQSRLDQTKAQLDEARSKRVSAENQLAGYRKVQKDINEIYNVEWSTEPQRLISFIREIMRLTGVSQLTPKSYSFSGSPTHGPKAGGANAIIVGMSFPVEGTYQQVRQLINLLETSDQFVIVDEIGGLSSGNGDKLSVNIHVKTLFRDVSPPQARASNQES